MCRRHRWSCSGATRANSVRLRLCVAFALGSLLARSFLLRERQRGWPTWPPLSGFASRLHRIRVAYAKTCRKGCRIARLRGKISFSKKVCFSSTLAPIRIARALHCITFCLPAPRIAKAASRRERKAVRIESCARIVKNASVPASGRTACGCSLASTSTLPC